MKRHGIPAWTSFRPVTFSEAEIERVRRQFGEASAEAARNAEMWRNSRFQVLVRRNVPNGFGRRVDWLSIKTLQAPRARHDWRELQQIKNELCGEECEAIELYPAESRLQDTADQFHLWVFALGDVVPVGFGGRMVSDGQPVGPGASQRRFEERPADCVVAHNVEFTRWIVDVDERGRTPEPDQPCSVDTSDREGR